MVRLNYEPCRSYLLYQVALTIELISTSFEYVHKLLGGVDLARFEPGGLEVIYCHTAALEKESTLSASCPAQVEQRVFHLVQVSPVTLQIR